MLLHMIVVFIYYSASFNDSGSSSEGSDYLLTGPDVMAKISNIGASRAFSSDYYKYMESKKNRHSFSAGNNCCYYIWTILLILLQYKLGLDDT